MKSGWKTTEFWLALGVNVIAVAALFGLFEQADVEQVQGAYKEIVAGVAAVIGNAVYVWSRTRVKQNGNR
jgi:hypothetical protein